MEFIIDTVDLEEIKDAIDHMPITGVTSNPSIVKATSPKNFFEHMKEVRKIIGKKEASMSRLFLKIVMK
ncbi:MAG: transaldolase family protein [Thomasclavelia sp.]